MVNERAFSDAGSSISCFRVTGFRIFPSDLSISIRPIEAMAPVIIRRIGMVKAVNFLMIVTAPPEKQNWDHIVRKPVEASLAILLAKFSKVRKGFWDRWLLLDSGVYVRCKMEAYSGLQRKGKNR